MSPMMSSQSPEEWISLRCANFRGIQTPAVDGSVIFDDINLA